MVGLDQASTERLPASLGRGSRGTVRRSDNDDRVLSLGAGELLGPAWGEEPKTKAAKERRSTALCFASFPVPLWGTGRAVKGRDARPAGALDSPPRAQGDLSSFLLDSAGALTDGQLSPFFLRIPRKWFEGLFSHWIGKRLADKGGVVRGRCEPTSE